MNNADVRFKFLPRVTADYNFTFADICAGIGGMRLAFENLDGKCVFSSEWDKFCQQTYCKNFGEIPSGDITKIPIKKIPRHDIMLAGFPCQPFSKAGFATRRKLNKKNGFYDKTQGNLFFHLEKIIAKKKPKVIFLENVTKLHTYNNGKNLEIILSRLRRLGYSVTYEIINSDGLVPQRRVRLYIVGLLNDSEFTFPKIPNLETKLRNILEKRVDEKYVLSDRLWTWLQKHAKKHAKKGNGFGYRMADKNKTTCTLSARYYKDGSEILIPRRNGNPRRLTPRECARLMGFPDEFKITVSDKQAYKQFGNSVVVPVVYLIGSSIIKHLNKKQSKDIKIIVKTTDRKVH